MSEPCQSLLTLLGLIFVAVGVFVLAIVWWFNRYVDEVLDQDRSHIHD